MSTNTQHPTPTTRAERRRLALSAMLNRLNYAGDVAERLLDHEQPEIQLRAVHALTQCAATYAKVYEVGELEHRFEVLEQRWQLEHAPTPGALPGGDSCNGSTNEQERNPNDET
jgi:hypothetical protein